jgi:roadblock/LC7 domain-containing protein
MASLEELLQIDGVAAAGEFGKDGSLIDYKSNMDMSPELAAGAAQFCGPPRRTSTTSFEFWSPKAESMTSGRSWPSTDGRCAQLELTQPPADE